MDPEAAGVITPHLLAREELLWCGRPHDTAALRWRAGVIILVGIAALVLRSLPLDSSLAERADTNSILLAIIVGVLIAEAIVFLASDRASFIQGAIVPADGGRTAV